MSDDPQPATGGRAPSLLDHLGDLVAESEEDAVEVDREDLVPLLERVLGHRLRRTVERHAELWERKDVDELVAIFASDAQAE